MVDPADVAVAAATAITGRVLADTTYCLTGPAALTFHEVADQLSAAIGRPVGYVDVPDAAAQTAMVEAGMPEWLARNLVILFGLMRDGAAATVTDDVQSLIGRAPRGFADFACEHAELFSS